MVDYIRFYAGRTDYGIRRDNWCKLIQMQKTFSYIAAESQELLILYQKWINKKSRR